VEERRATIAQKEALAFAVRLPQSSPDIHTHERRGRLRFDFEMALPGLSFARASQFALRAISPPSKEESDRIEDLNVFALVARTCLLGLVSCLRPGSLLSSAALAPYGLYRMSLIGEELPFACSRR
jgi:hypothetical protein